MDQAVVSGFGRRALGRMGLGLGAVALAGGVTGIFPALGAAIPPSGAIVFDVRRGSSQIGTHRIAFRREGSRLAVDISIDLVVTIALIPVFRYTHRNREVWQEGRLIAIDTRTDDDGTPFRVTGRAGPGGFTVDGNEGRIAAPADIIPTSYWNAATVERSQLLDTQKGRLLTVANRMVNREALTLGGRNVPARHYRMTGDLEVDTWYSEPGQWVKLAFSARGAEVEYALTGGASAVATAG